MSYQNNKKYKPYQRENKYDKSFNSIDKIQAQLSFKPNEKFLLVSKMSNKIKNIEI